MKRNNLVGALISMPAVLIYCLFVIYPLISAVGYSFTDWDGIGEKQFIGLANYTQIFQSPELVASIKNALSLIVFSAFSIFFGLLLANFIVRIRTHRIRSITQVVLFFPQILPLAASGIAWSWMYAKMVWSINS